MELPYHYWVWIFYSFLSWPKVRPACYVNRSFAQLSPVFSCWFIWAKYTFFICILKFILFWSNIDINTCYPCLLISYESRKKFQQNFCAVFIKQKYFVFFFIFHSTSNNIWIEVESVKINAMRQSRKYLEIFWRPDYEMVW